MEFYLICLIALVASIAGIIQAIRWLHEADSVWTWIGAGTFTLLVLYVSGLVSWIIIGCNLPGQDQSTAPPLWVGYIPTMLFGVYWALFFGGCLCDWARESYGAYLDVKEDKEERLHQEAKKEVDSMFHYLDQLLDRSQPFGPDQAMTVNIICEKLGLPKHHAITLVSLHTRPESTPSKETLS